jgi:hypothetical protein
MLEAFDAHRELICAAAVKVYRREQKGSYELGVVDF